MSLKILEKAVTANKFRGTLVGALIGDCFGAPFHNDENVAKVILQKYFDRMEDPTFKSPAKSYTDDTVMTKAVTESLVHHGSLNELDLAKRFVDNFFLANEPERYYGEYTTAIFRKLRNTNFEDIWVPAKEQFDGEGSFGSGGAMRVSPIALYFYSNYDSILLNVKKCTKLTHTHKIGINGALLQAIAINQSFFMLPSEPLNVFKFIDDIIIKMSQFENEKDNTYHDNQDPFPFKNRLIEIQNLLKKDELEDEEVVAKLGNNESALNSVPTAIYCFLRSQKPIKKIMTENKFRRAIQYSISLGGDTDTIASLTGAMSGAYYGYENINKNIQTHCEKYNEIISLADQLHDIASKNIT